MPIATYYLHNPAAPKPNLPTHYGANVWLVWQDRLLLERRSDCDLWGLIGGGRIYAALLDRCSRAYITRVNAAVTDADTFFPDLDSLPEWAEACAEAPVTENGLTYQFVEYVREEK